MPTPSQTPLPPEVLSALKAGNTIEAIKHLRQSTGLGLKEAKAIIDGQPPAPSAAASIGALPLAVMQALQRGQKIEAIRLLREDSGMGLAQAKAAVEAQQVVPPHRGELGPGEVPRSSGRVWLIVVVLAVLALAWYKSQG